MPNPDLELRVDSIALTGDFQSLSPNSPLPWSEYHTPETCTVVIVDAKNVDVCTIKRDNFPDAMRIAGMILCAVNTCGGIRMTES